MNESFAPGPEIHADLRANEVREWQLWSLTLGLLILFGAGAVAGLYVLLSAQLDEGATRQIAYRLLGGLAVLIVLFCLHVLHVRMSVARFKRLLHEMNGMATCNLEVEDFLSQIARGIANAYRAPLSRILRLRTTDAALEILSTHAPGSSGPVPPDAGSYALKDLPLLQRAAETLQPIPLRRRDLKRLSPGTAERALLTGGLPGVSTVLVLPLRTLRETVGFLVLGLRRRPWERRLSQKSISTAVALARHAGTVIEEARRRKDAIRDPLTDLYNRRYFTQRAGEEIERAHRDGHNLAVLLCDLDRFKRVNDTRGHQFGDRVLRAVATAIQDATRGTDLHFRWGGDEIVVLLPKTAPEGFLVAAERIRDAVRRYAKTAELDIDVSIGIAVYPQHGNDEEELLRVADLAMYVAKRSGDRVRVGFEEYNLDEYCVRFAYQPILGCDSGEVLGHEVFTRDPGGQLSPIELFSKYRAAGQLTSLKRLIFERQIRQGRQAGVQRLFVNADLEFLQRVDPIPMSPGGDVVIEVSEADPNRRPEDRLAVFRKWRRAGYRFALDDFGAGYVSLPVLEELRPDYIKVDRSSIVHAVGSPSYREFLLHLLRAARSCAPGGLVAEGIERDSELQVARELGITYAQGYLLGRPAEPPLAGDRAEVGLASSRSV